MDQGKENNSSCSGYHQCFIFFAFSDLLEKDDFVFATFGFYLQRQTHTGGNLSFDYFFLCSFDEYFCVGGFFQWQLNPGKSPFQRTYANQVKRYAEMSRKLRFFHDQVAKAGKLAYRPIMENVTDLDELDHKLGDLESELLEINANNDKLQSSQSELTELKLVLQNVSFTLPFVL
jgi:hypothetical protein